MPDTYNTPPVSSIFPVIPNGTDVEETAEIGSKPLDTNSDENTIIPSPVYEALYGNSETTNTHTPFNESETSSITTITETPKLQTETDAIKSKPTTPTGEIPGNQPVSTGATLLTIRSDEEEKRAIDGFTQKVPTII